MVGDVGLVTYISCGEAGVLELDEKPILIF